MTGSSKIQVDKDTVNILLKEFAAKEGTEVSFEGGEFRIKAGALKLAVKELPLKSTRLELQGKSGKVQIEVADFKLEESQLSVDLTVGLP